MVKVLISLDDFYNNRSNEDLYASCFCAFLFLWVFQGSAFLLYTFFGSGKIFGPYKHRVILARHTMDVFAMVSFSVMGFEVMNFFGGFQSFAEYKNASGAVATSTERVYYFSAAAQRLIACQLAYECKNFCDSLLHNDGAIFLVHHAATALLATCGFNPFLHFYSSFFFGISEVSTAILCALVCFDKDRGIPPLAKSFPILMKILGVSFAVAFILFRVILWPYVSYYFWVDCLAVLRENTAHSHYVVYLFLVANVFLTSLQILWLGEIFSTASRVLYEKEPSGHTAKKTK